jgi:hypothetical protein
LIALFARFLNDLLLNKAFVVIELRIRIGKQRENRDDYDRGR